MGRTQFVCGRRGLRPARGVEVTGVADQAFFQNLSAVQALVDAGEDQRDVTGIEVADLGGGSAALDLGGEVATVVDELANQCEETADAALLGRASGGIG